MIDNRKQLSGFDINLPPGCPGIQLFGKIETSYSFIQEVYSLHLGNRAAPYSVRGNAGNSSGGGYRTGGGVGGAGRW